MLDTGPPIYELSRGFDWGGFAVFVGAMAGAVVTLGTFTMQVLTFRRQNQMQVKQDQNSVKIDVASAKVDVASGKIDRLHDLMASHIKEFDNASDPTSVAR